jgi:hypothetical protein
MHDHASEADEMQEMVTSCRIEVYISYLDNLCIDNKGQTHTHRRGEKESGGKRDIERPRDWAVICSDTGENIERKTEGKRKRADGEKDIIRR